MQDTRQLLVHQETSFPVINRAKLEILQVNLGYLCNLSCVHCHVNAGPTRKELMDLESINLVLKVLTERKLKVLDLTGGAPELNPHFKYLVQQATALGVEVIDRCNLTVLNEPGQEQLADFLASQKVKIVASLPCYSQDNVDQQRGKGTFDSSILALKKLNALGYGLSSDLQLDLVYNPQGAVLPPPQEALEKDYKNMLKQNFDIDFNHLLTITNMPISRFGAVLLAHNEFNQYIDLLKQNYSEKNLLSVMCRNLVSVDWQGNLFDCDFNQMLKIPSLFRVNEQGKSKRLHLRDLLQYDLENNQIQIADHCFGCTAGQGSSCSGAL